MARLPSINFGSLFATFVFLAIIVLLSIKIFEAFTHGVDTISKFNEERVKLEQLQQINAELKSQVEHYASLEYKKMYARENLNLGDKNENLYYIDRPDESLVIEELPEREVEITLADNISFWKKLILDQ